MVIAGWPTTLARSLRGSGGVCPPGRSDLRKRSVIEQANDQRPDSVLPLGAVGMVSKPPPAANVEHGLALPVLYPLPKGVVVDGEPDGVKGQLFKLSHVLPP